MRHLFYLVSFLFFSGISISSYAQIDSYIKSKAKTATSRAAQNTDKEVDSQINKAVDKEFNKLKEKVLKDDEEEVKASENEEPAQSEDSGNQQEKKNSISSGDDAMSKAIMGKLGIQTERPANMKDKYEYTGNIVMDVETWNEEGESEGVVAYTSHISDKNTGIAMEFVTEEKGHSYMIFDYENQLMLILAEDGQDKSGFASPLSGYSQDSAVASAQPQPADYDAEYLNGFKKTGRSKTIAGYSCDEYIFENETDISTYWMTRDLPADLWAKMATSNAFTALYTGSAGGFVMETDHQQKASKERSHMVVKEVNKSKPATISTLGYTIITMSAPPAQEEEGK